MDQDYGFGEFALLCLAGQGLGQQLWVHVPGDALAVDEDRLGPLIDHRIGAGGEGEGGDQHFVARAHAQVDESQVDGRGAGAEGQGVFGAHHLTELALEGIDIGAKRRDPVGVEGVLYVLLFQTGHMGRGKIEALIHGG